MAFTLKKSDLNFRVYTATETPGTGNENDIVIISATPMKNWILSPDAPSGTPRNDGDVLIQYSVSDDTWNALKQGAFQIAIMSAFQYVDGAWAEKTAMIYQGGEWAGLFDGVLYDHGNERENITGGWFLSRNYSATLTKNSSNMVFNSDNSSTSSGITTRNDLSKFFAKYTHLNIMVSAYTEKDSSGSNMELYIGSSNNFNESTFMSSLRNSDPVSSNRTFTIDIPTASAMYPWILAHYSSITIEKVWLS